MPFHPLLERQLRRLEIEVDDMPPGWAALLARVSHVYANADLERYRLEHTIQTCSDEMLELNDNLSHEHERLQAIVASMGDAFCVLDAEGRLTFANREAERLLGAHHHDLLGRSFEQFWSKGDLLEARQLASTNDGYRSESCHITNTTGVRIDVAVSLTPLTPNAKPDATDSVLVFRDVRERKLAEDALRASEARFRTIFQTAVVGMTRADRSGTILDCNEAYARMLGYERGELIGRSWLEFILPEDSSAPWARVDLRPMTFERRYRHRDGRTIWGAVTVSVIERADESPFVFAVVHDITKERELEVTLRHAQKLEAVGRLAAGVAHEINTPMQFVGNNLEFLRTSFDALKSLYQRARDLLGPGPLHEIAKLEAAADFDFLSVEAPNAITEALEGTASVTGIVAAMKVFAHQDQGDQTLVDLNAAVHSVITVARSETKYVADVVLELGEVPPIMAFSGDLNQVLLNLVVNAAHAITDAHHKGRGAITIRTRLEDADVILSVQDTGTGISDTIRDRVFDPFFTTKEVGRGSGQGLALARAMIVDKHGGSLTFETTAGEGTTFHVRLPVAGRRERSSRGAEAAA